MSENELHSVVVPMYNEQETAEQFYRRATDALRGLPDYEIIAVDDGSADRTGEILTALAASDPHLKVVRFSRNFGHQTAITAGVDFAHGDTVTVIDADLQDPPELITQMVDEWRRGAEVVFAVRESRAGESPFKRWTASAFYRVLRRLTPVDIPQDAGDFRLMSRKAASCLRLMREHNRYVRGLVGWIGMKRAFVTYRRDPRFAGETKYPLRKMVRFAADGIVSFSTRPLHMASWLGLAAVLVGFVMAIWALVEQLIAGRVVEGWTWLMIAVLFIGGIQLVTLGIIGEYVGRIYDEVRRRPLYLVDQVEGFGPDVAERFEPSPAGAPVESGGAVPMRAKGSRAQPR